MAKEPRVIDLNPPGLRTDDYCPVCNAQPRSTIPAGPPENFKSHRQCLTCNQVWEEHGDHTPVDVLEQPSQVTADMGPVEATPYNPTLMYFREMQARGRNGGMQQWGIDITMATVLAEPLHSYILLRPITSRGDTSGASYMEIPLEAITEFIAKLEEAQRVLLTEIEKLINPAETQT